MMMTIIAIGEAHPHLNEPEQTFEMLNKAHQSGKAHAFKGHDDAWEFHKPYNT